MTPAFCWAHLRPRFYDVAKSGATPLASEGLSATASWSKRSAVINLEMASRRRLHSGGTLPNPGLVVLFIVPLIIVAAIVLPLVGLWWRRRR